MISEGSCDTEDRINDAENSVLNYNKKIETSCFIVYFTILLVYFFSAFSLGEHTRLFKNIKNLIDLTRFNGSVYRAVKIFYVT